MNIGIIPNNPTIFVDSDNDKKIGNAIIYYNQYIKRYVIFYNNESGNHTVYVKNDIELLRIMRYSWKHLNITFNYPITFSKEKKQKVNKLIGETTSVNKCKSRLMGFIGLLG